MKALFFLAAPPVIGALIGYVTNAVAIKMLFRPLKPVRVFGIRLPFTPGVLPRERHKLADSIGSMVERKLLTPEILRERLLREDVRAAINGAIARHTGGVLDLPLGLLLAGEKEGAPFPFFIFRDFLSSPAFNSLVESCLESLAGYVKNSPLTLGELLGEERTGILREKITAAIRETLESQAPQIGRYAASALDAAFPVLVRQLLQFLMKDGIHRGLETQGWIFLNNAITKLSTLQRFFISAGQYDKTLHERMPEIIDDLIGQLEVLLHDPDMRRHLVSFAEERVRGAVTRDGVSHVVASMAMSYTAMPLGEAVKKLAAGDLRTVIRGVRECIRRNGGPDIGQTLGGAVNRLLTDNRDRTLADFFLIDRAKKEKIDAAICAALEGHFLSAAGGRFEALLKHINIRTLVSDRIDSLDMVDVEHIVLDVMDNQLKWINVFGAILGALIGGSQVLLSWFAP
ncbi:MAG: DUF445 family protein [Treponema sp.]|jgi:hypothetical protein|nr:DUF445 family protein [Treponema sp.]